MNIRFVADAEKRVADYLEVNLWQVPAPGLETLTIEQAHAVRDLVMRTVGVTLAPLFKPEHPAPETRNPLREAGKDFAEPEMSMEDTATWLREQSAKPRINPRQG